uniref:WH2 domain-containing protein n=1 Tax=Trichuris muris TaxID=70415 RepID=A0A5S6QXR0_TRIMR
MIDKQQRPGPFPSSALPNARAIRDGRVHSPLAARPAGKSIFAGIQSLFFLLAPKVNDGERRPKGDTPTAARDQVSLQRLRKNGDLKSAGRRHGGAPVAAVARALSLLTNQLALSHAPWEQAAGPGATDPTVGQSTRSTPSSEQPMPGSNEDRRGAVAGWRLKSSVRPADSQGPTDLRAKRGAGDHRQGQRRSKRPSPKSIVSPRKDRSLIDCL